MDLVFLNCYLRSPGWLFRDDQKERIKMIPAATIQNKKTICGLSEVFGHTYINDLTNQYKKYNFNLLSPKTNSSGLAIAYCMDQYEPVGNVIFEKYVVSAWPDNMAKKGILYCKLRCKDCGNIFNIIVTHLQSAYEESSSSNSLKISRYRSIQEAQLYQLKRFVLKHNLTQYIIMGDFNIDNTLDHPLFPLFLTLFNYHDKRDLLPTAVTYPKSRYRIDYILVNGYQHFKTKTDVLSTKTFKIIQQNMAQNNVNYISDHFPIHTVL